ncbi:MAG: 16S rRNA (guanine(966)-N(2))-methyltransferase RsmD [Candidatus Dadabacteria bacterium]|nr:MAG: 16S rRNA (guanine(966)-N(2))-methyltransferase RsmD [Candidatus Dadabacteria bacterium]
MRVIAGTAKGRRIDAVPGNATRPLLSRIRKSLFDIISDRIVEAAVLDLFAGSGSVGIEALSRGASECVFIDIDGAAISTIKKNLNNTGLADRAKVFRTDAFKYLKRSKASFDFIYIAPPQYKGLWEEALLSLAERPNLLTIGGQGIVQIDPREYEPLAVKTLRETDQRSYGNTLLVFYERTN